MHQFKIEGYMGAGDAMRLAVTRYADSVEEARRICGELDSQKDELGIRAYTQIRLHLGCYKLCQDRAAFFAQFQA